MGLVCFTESVEACMTYLLDPTPYLFRRKGMAITQDMLVFASAINKDRLPVKEELSSPFDVTNTKRCTHLISGLAVTFNHRREIIKIRIVKAPTMGILYLLSMTQDNGLTGLNRRLFCMAEHLFTRGKRKLIHQFYLLGLLGVVLDLCLDKYGVAGGIVPNMHTKRFNTDGIRFYQTDRTEDAKRLATLAEAVF